MTYKGKVQNGVVVLPPDAQLPEGAEVFVEPVESAEEVSAQMPEARLLTPENDSLVALFTKLAKPRPHWPDDYGINHDHYLYGTPKREP